MLDTNDDNAKVARLAVDESLSLMRTDYIDLMLIHYPASEFSASDDPTNAKRRRDAYLELQILKGDNRHRVANLRRYTYR
jgi:diketogulonate reductase-like aldo/keto reductase